MALRITPQQIENAQGLEATVTGPDGANRLFILTGSVPVNLSAFSSTDQVVQRTETFTVLVGPLLERRQFVQAVATASIARALGTVQTAPMRHSWQIVHVDADWDDESRQVELRVEVTVTASGTSNQLALTALSYQVTILAEIPGQA